MVTINNSEVNRALGKAIKLQETEGVPNELTNALAAVIDVTPVPSMLVTKSFFGTRTTTGTATIETLDADKDFYLTNATMFVQCDASADSTDYSMRVVMDGEAQRIIQIEKISLTATSQIIAMNFPIPLKLDRSSAITMVQSFTLGASSISGTIQGFYRE